MLKIRKATKKDLPVIIDLWKEFGKEHDKIILPKNKSIKGFFKKSKTAEQEYKRFTKRNLRSKKALILIAYVNNELAGYALHLIKPKEPIYGTKETGYMNDLFIKNKYQGKGISTIFKNLGLKWFKENNIEFVTLHVFNGNKHAEEIYKKWGFKELQKELIKSI